MLLHIDDIVKMHKNYPFPKEITDIRNHITDAFKDLRFDPVPHKYYVPTGKLDPNGNPIEMCLESATTFLKRFEQPVDWDQKARDKAIRTGSTYEAIKREWDETKIIAANNGTSTHLFLESYMWFFLGMPERIDPVILPQYESGYLVPYGPKQEAGVKYFERIYNTINSNDPFKKYPVMPETKMYIFEDNPFGITDRIAGTMDILLAFCDVNGWNLICDDWKTNKSLYNDYNRTYQVAMCYPFDDYIDEAYGHYTLQLSAYTLMLRQLNYRVPYRNLVWLKDDGNFERIKINDLSDRFITYDREI